MFEIFTAFASGASIIGLLWIIVSAYGKSRKGLYVARRTSKWVAPHLEWSEKLSIAVGEVRVRQVVLERFLISNRTGDVLRAEKFVKEIAFHFPREEQFLCAKVHSGRDLVDANYTVCDGIISLSFAYMLRGEAISIELLMSAECSGLPDISVEGFPYPRKLDSGKELFTFTTILIGIFPLTIGLLFGGITFTPLWLGSETDASASDAIFTALLILLILIIGGVATALVGEYLGKARWFDKIWYTDAEIDFFEEAETGFFTKMDSRTTEKQP
jgi:hypothetical protein